LQACRLSLPALDDHVAAFSHYLQLEAILALLRPAHLVENWTVLVALPLTANRLRSTPFTKTAFKAQIARDITRLLYFQRP
jgi:hypothetical protein